MPPADRRAFVAERRAASAHRYDTIHSPRYDENWGAISPSHAAFVARLAGLVRQGGVLLPQGPAYVTVELPDGPLPPPADPRQVPGEVTDGGGYHYYPPRRLVRGWLEAAGFTIAEQADADSYWHLLLTRGPAAPPG